MGIIIDAFTEECEFCHKEQSEILVKTKLIFQVFIPCLSSFVTGGFFSIALMIMIML